MQAKETTLQKMLSGTKVFLVPLFQRRYKWGGDDWHELWEDILGQYDHPDVRAGTMKEGEGHFLGSIVLHPAPGPASTVTRYLVVDGQQRLTTLLILLAVLRDVRSEHEPDWNRAAYDHQFLTNPFNPEHPFRLIPTVRDRDAFQNTVFGNRPTGQPGRAYTFFADELQRLLKRDSAIDFERLELTVLLRLLVVDITTSAGDNVNHIFHTLNHAGQKLSPLDLVRNRIFMSLDENVLEAAYENLWQPVEIMLGDTNAQRYLWAQVARSDAKATQKDLYPAYERRLTRLGALAQSRATATVVHDELRRLHDEAWLYASIVDPPSLRASMEETQRPSLPQPLIVLLQDLKDWGSNTHLPLTLECLSRHQSEMAAVEDVTTALRHILSFMVRRSLCAIPTNNLNRIFTSLPSLLDDQTLSPQLELLLSAEQRYWPTDEEVGERLVSTPIYATAQPAQVKFVLERLEWRMGAGEIVDTSNLQVEHVLPQHPGADWYQYLVENGDAPETTYARIHTLGNLTLTGYNPELGRQTFDRKLRLYSDSLVQLTRGLASASVWNEAAIVARARQLADLAVQVWPGPVRDGKVIAGEDRGDIADLLTRLPEDAWTTLETLAEYFAVPKELLMERVNELDPVLAVKVLGSDGGLPDWIDESRRELLVSELAAAGYRATPPIFDCATSLGLSSLRESDLFDESTDDSAG